MNHVTFAAWLAVIGCRSEDKPKPPPPPPPTDGLELISAGAPPRQPLRYRLARDTRSSIEIAVDVDLTTVDGAVSLPTIALALDVITATVDPDGTGIVRTTVTGAAARERPGTESVMKLMNRQVALVVGLVQSARLSPTGQLSESKLDASGRDLAKPMQEQVTTLAQALEGVVMPLPVDPVGVGAAWNYRRTLQLNQLTVIATTQVQVTAIDGDRVSYTSTTQLTGADQILVQGEASVQVTGVKGQGTAHGTADLAKVTVIGEHRAELGFTMAAGEQLRPTTMTMTTRTTPATASPAAAPEPGSASQGSDVQGAHNAP